MEELRPHETCIRKAGNRLRITVLNKAVDCYQRALALDAGYARAWILRQALDRDPLNLLARRCFARTLYYADRLADAEAEIRQLLELSTAYPVAHYELGRILLAQGAVSEAVAAFDAEAAPNWRTFCLPLGYHAQGRTTDAQAARRSAAQGADR